MVNASKKNLENVQIDALDLLVLLYYYLYYCITMLLNYMSWLLSKAVFTSEYLFARALSSQTTPYQVLKTSHNKR